MARRRSGGLIDPHGGASQAFRALRLATSSSPGERERTLLFTSSVGKEGATTVATNYAVVAAATGRRTLVIDANLQHPDVHNRFGTAAGPGVTDVVLGRRSEAECIEAVSPDGAVSVDVLPAGTPVRMAADVLASREMADLLAWAEGEYDVVTLDSAPAGKYPDTFALATIPEVNTVVVARRGQRRANLERALIQLQRTDARLLGVVYNEG